MDIQTDTLSTKTGKTNRGKPQVVSDSSRTERGLRPGVDITKSVKKLFYRVGKNLGEATSYGNSSEKVQHIRKFFCLNYSEYAQLKCICVPRILTAENDRPKFNDSKLVTRFWAV